MLGTVGLTVVVLGAADVQRFGPRDSILREAGSAVGWMVRLCRHGTPLPNKMIASLCKSSLSRESFKMVRMKWDDEVNIFL